MTTITTTEQTALTTQEQQQPELLALDLIQRDGGTQARAGLNEETVQDYVHAIQNFAHFPPVVVYFDGTDTWLADGFHRCEAYKQTGRLSIPAEIRQGTRRDAILHAAGANAAHGLRRTNADKRRAVETLLRDQEWSKWSDREIARLCAVDHKFVGKLRNEMSLGTIPSERTYTTKHGTQATMKTANVGKKQAPEPEPAPEEEPEEEPEFDPSPVSVALDDQFEEPYPPLPAARIIDMSEERREAMMAELETLGYDVKYNKGCVSNKCKGAPGHMNENLYYVEEFERRLQIARQNFEREQEQQAERDRMRAEIARRREEYQSWPEQAPVCGETIIQCMIDAHRLLQAGEAQQAKVQAQRFRAHPDVASYIGSAIRGMQRAMELHNLI